MLQRFLFSMHFIKTYQINTLDRYQTPYTLRQRIKGKDFSCLHQPIQTNHKKSTLSDDARK